MIKIFHFSLFIVLAFTNLILGNEIEYENGDLIFQESLSSQSKAIKEATDSRWSHVGILFTNNKKWFVAEAVQPVKITPIQTFISRGKNKDYLVYRLPGLTKQEKMRLQEQVKLYLGKKYDIYFEWTNEKIYCSELIYKSYLEAIGIEIGTLQSFRDLNIDGPYVKALIQRRLKDTGRKLNLDEKIVTPASQVNDEKLILINSNTHH